MLKRIFDILFSSVVLLLFLPFGVLISLAIYFTDFQSIFYKQARVGQNGKIFYMYKFRSMRKNAHKEGKLTVGMKDSRITKVGVFLRKFKLDEFPQFINVLLGNMSIVGPRPEVKDYVFYYTPEQRKVLELKPGITDLASLHYFKENELLAKANDPKATYINEIMPAKLNINLAYCEQQSFLFDLKIIAKTFLKILT